MGTEFRDADGRLVARRYWGGDERGVVIELEPNAVTHLARLLAWSANGAATSVPLLHGDDGSETNLVELAAQAGTNRLSPAAVLERRRQRREKAARLVGDRLRSEVERREKEAK